MSNDKCNQNSAVVEVVYLTTQPKADLPTHVDIRSAQRNSIAICEQITSVSVDRIGDFIGECSEYEQQMLDAAMAISLDLDFPTPTKPEKKVVRETSENARDKSENEKLEKKVIELTAQRDAYREMYQNLLEKVVSA